MSKHSRNLFGHHLFKRKKQKQNKKKFGGGFENEAICFGCMRNPGVIPEQRWQPFDTSAILEKS